MIDAGQVTVHVSEAATPLSKHAFPCAKVGLPRSRPHHRRATQHHRHLPYHRERLGHALGTIDKKNLIYAGLEFSEMTNNAKSLANCAS